MVSANAEDWCIGYAKEEWHSEKKAVRCKAEEWERMKKGHWVWWRKASQQRRFYSKNWPWTLFLSQGFSQEQGAIVIIIGWTIAPVSIPVDSNRRDGSFTYVGYSIVIRAELGLPGLQDVKYTACIHSDIIHYWPHFLKFIFFKYCSLLILLDYERHVKVWLHASAMQNVPLWSRLPYIWKTTIPFRGRVRASNPCR